jgi:hypothetical protein
MMTVVKGDPAPQTSDYKISVPGPGQAWYGYLVDNTDGLMPHTNADPSKALVFQIPTTGKTITVGIGHSHWFKTNIFLFLFFFLGKRILIIVDAID